MRQTRPDGTDPVQALEAATESGPGLVSRMTNALMASRPGRALGGLLLVCAIGALAAGCGPYRENTFAPTSDYAQDIANLFIFIIAMCAIVFVVVEGLLIGTAIRFRGKPGDPRPRPIHGNTNLEIVWTILPVIILIIIGVPTVGLIFKYQADAPPGSMPITAVGHQWWFEFRYPDQNFVTANEAHIPAGRPVRVELESADVIHSWWPPNLAGKRDMIPNHKNYVWFTGHHVGPDFGSCTEFCGESHAKMGFDIVTDTPADFDTWVANQQKVPAPPTDARLRQGAKVFASASCVACHTISGTTAQGKVGPNLTHVGSRLTIAGRSLENTPETMKLWIRNPAATKPGEGQASNTMPATPESVMSDADLGALVSYLQSLK